MSTPDQPSTPPLTRRQLRELRNTGSTPIIPPKAEEKGEPTPLPRAAEPAPIPPGPRPDAADRCQRSLWGNQTRPRPAIPRLVSANIF